MELYPAIDLKDGQCVRLKQGAFDSVYKVANDPVTVAEDYREAGAAIIHVVDLDGARDGERRNAGLLAAIVRSAAPAKIELGGGLRCMEDLKNADKLGVWRFIIGSAAVMHPDFVTEAIKVYGDRIAVGVDAKDGFVRTHGWEQGTELPEVEFAQKMANLGVRTIIYTDISTDGLLMGPSLERVGLLRIALPPQTELVVSGGVGHLSHITAIRKMGAKAAIVGAAIYEGSLSLTEGLAEARYGVLFDKQELVPAIIQDDQSGDILMLGYMNRRSLGETLQSGRAVFWSRSRERLWVKGESSGNYLDVVTIQSDCDEDTLLLRCTPRGPVCHTGERSCFFNTLWTKTL